MGGVVWCGLALGLAHVAHVACTIKSAAPSCQAGVYLWWYTGTGSTGTQTSFKRCLLVSSAHRS